MKKDNTPGSGGWLSLAETQDLEQKNREEIGRKQLKWEESIKDRGVGQVFEQFWAPIHDLVPEITLY